MKISIAYTRNVQLNCLLDAVRETIYNSTRNGKVIALKEVALQLGTTSSTLNKIANGEIGYQREFLHKLIEFALTETDFPIIVEYLIKGAESIEPKGGDL